MRSDIHKKVELAANVAIAAVAVLLCAVLVKNYLLPRAAPADGAAANRQDQMRTGVKLSVPGVEWRGGGNTLLLTLSTTCRFCTDSAPFYQQLLKERDRGVRVVAVLPQPVADGQAYLNRLGVSVDDVRQASLGSLDVRGTPTLTLVNGEGVIIGEWVGRLPPDQEAEVLSKVQTNGAGN